MKIAEVIINTQVKSLDKVYHYLADESLNLQEGVRVEVPFGYGNRKMIGYFTGFVEKSEFKNLKEIIRVIDEKPMISKYGFELARYIKKTCLSSMSEAFRLLLPPMVHVKVELKVKLINPNFTDKLTPLQTNTVNTLKAAGGYVEMKKLMEAANVKSSTVIKGLEKKGIVKIEENTIGSAKEKTRKFVSLAIEEEEARAALEDLKASAKAAAAAFEVIAEHESLPVSDVLEMANCSYSSIEVLQKREYVTIEIKEIFRSPIQSDIERTENYAPTSEQKTALDTINYYLDKQIQKNMLLYGVTGSGKTEVFLQAAQRCINSGRNAVILVPEIALTPQMVERFVSRFGENVALLHSGLSMGERYDQWRKIKNGDVHLVVGARSAIFAPFDNIGLIVVDEEHENTYKSESSPRYNAIDVALFRGKQYNSIVLLASATPSVESFYKAQKGEYKLLTLQNRHNNQSMPSVEIVDMTQELAAGNKTVISRRLADEIYKNLQNGEQTILFLNRRGYSTFISCRNCGFVAKCPHCSISLTYHSEGNSLHCHYCGYKTNNLDLCPECGSVYIRYFGTGTQKVEDDLKRTFPGISILRMDADTTKQKLSHQKLFAQFKDENINVLLGTQMVTKGLDFPSVTLVGVLSADILLNMDDFRAGERTFSQLTQVCGRAGRGDIPGRAIIQTYSPADPTLGLASKQDYLDFFGGEIKMREAFLNPPFVKIINILISGDINKKTMEYAGYISDLLQNELSSARQLCTAYYGPDAAPITRLKNKFRYRILLKVASDDYIYNILEKVYYKHIENKTKFIVDISINPNSIL